MSAKKKAPLIKWWSAARGSGDDFTYYKKSRKMVTAVQVIAVVFGFLVTALKAIAFLFICTAAFAVMTLPAVDKPSFLNDNAALLSLWRELIPMLGVLFVTAVFVFVVEKKTIGVSIVKNPVRGIAYGFLPGCIMLGVPLLCLVFMGDISFGEQTGIPSLWAWFVAVALNAVTQEYLVRGYLFSLFKKAFNAAVAVILTAAIYTAMHTSAFEAGVIAVMNVVMMSVLASLLIIYTESLLAPILLRFIWNGLGGFVLGIVPLENNYPSLWNTVISGNDLISGGSAKLDGSILVLFVNVLLIAFMSFRTKKKARSQPPA